MTCTLNNSEINCKCLHDKRDILASDDEQLPTEIRMLKWLCSKDEDACVESGANIWQDVLYNFQHKRAKTKKCCMKGTCQKERAVCELLRFMKIMRSNMDEVKKYRPSNTGAAAKEHYMSVEPTFVLAHLSAKLLQFEKRLKILNCSKNDTCRLAMLIKNVKRTILVQFISGPRPNEALANSVRDVAYIDCVFKRLEKLCCCIQVEDKLATEAVVGLDKRRVIVDTRDIGVNTDPIRLHDRGVHVEVKYEDKDTSPDPFCKKKDYAEYRPGLKSKWLYFYRSRNNTKKTVFGSHGMDTEYFYDVRQINRYTSTCDTHFRGQLLYPYEEPTKVEYGSQTDACFTFSRCDYEITTTCISYGNETNTTELEQLPEITNPKGEYTCGVDYVNQTNEGTKNYMTKLNGVNIMAETVTGNNFSEMNLVLSNELSRTYTRTGMSNVTDAKINNLKQHVYYYARQIATNLINERSDVLLSAKKTHNYDIT